MVGSALFSILSQRGMSESTILKVLNVKERDHSQANPPQNCLLMIATTHGRKQYTDIAWYTLGGVLETMKAKQGNTFKHRSIMPVQVELREHNITSCNQYLKSYDKLN